MGSWLSLVFVSIALGRPGSIGIVPLTTDRWMSYGRLVSLNEMRNVSEGDLELRCERDDRRGW